MLNRENQIDKFRSEYASCKGVISEQICTFIACVALQLSAKYLEIKYPVVEDVCHLMQSPFTFDEFIEMEQALLQHFFDWDLCQISTWSEIIETLLAQGVVFSTDVFLKEDRKMVTVLEMTKADRARVIKKITNLAENILPNLLVYDAQLTLEEHPLYVCIAIVIEARRSSGALTLWPNELDFLVFGEQAGEMEEKVKLKIFETFLKVQLSVHKEIKIDNHRISRENSAFA